MFRRATKEINAEFPAEEGHLDNIRRIIRESCNAGGLSRKDTGAVLLAIEEGATNIIRHAYLYKKGVIRVRVVIYKKLMVFSLIDSGKSFSPPGSESLDFEKLVESGRKGGLGFYMIRKIMDSVEYISAAGFNEIRMVKRIGAAKSEGRPFLRRLMSLRVSFSLSTFLVVLVIVGGSYLYANFRASTQFEQHLNETVQSLGETIAEQAAGLLINRRSHVEFDQLIVSNMRANPELKLIVLTDSSGLIMAHSEDVRSLRKYYRFPTSIDSTAVSRPQEYKQGGRDNRYLLLDIPAGEKSLGSVHLVYTTENIKSRLGEARKQIAYVTLVLLLFGVVAIYMLSNYFVRPIAQITSRVRRFTSGDLETELPLEGAEEFFEISRAFNQMMTRLSRDRKNIIEREKLAKEMEVASEIQKTLLPNKLPDLPGLDLDAVYRPASVVSGDLYDVFKVAEDRYCLTVADVSGKGVPASLVMSMLRTLIRIYAVGEDSPKLILKKVNDFLSGNMPAGMFITIMLVIYHVKESRVDLVSAGHNPLLYYGASDSSIRQINPQGMPLGMPDTLNGSFSDSLEEVSEVLKEDDLLFIFTDGLSEANSPTGQRYGLQKLAEFLAAGLSQPDPMDVRQLSQSITEELDAFAGYAPPSDDISFIIARRLSPTKENAPSPDAVDSQKLQDSP